MEKKKISKLRLNKKTLRNLDDNKLAEVRGGATETCTDTTYCTAGCTITRACSECTRACSICCL